MTAIRTTCAYCGVGCGISAEVTGARSVTIRGDTDHPANRGALCSKGTHLGETVGLDGRLLHPMIGAARASWDDALDMTARAMAACIAEHGPDSVAFYVSGQLLTEDYYVANKLMKGFIGSGNIDTNSRLCMASAVAAHARAFGEDVVPVTYEDLDEADLIVLVGSNTAWCHPVIWQRIERARAAHGTRLVVIDPRRTETADQADLHVPVAPDGDVALFVAVLAAMRERGLVDEAFLREQVETPDGFWDLAVAQPEPGPVPGGVSGPVFAALVDLIAAHPRMVTLFSQGVNQSTSGTDKANAIINLHLATGRINRPGAGPFSITGQPNAMGGREVGGLANMLACHLGFSPAEREDVAAFWQAPNVCAGPGLKAVEMFRAIHDGRIRFLWVMATNPAVSMPDADFVRAALARCPTVVVSEVIADTDTSRFAHVRLPALGWGEKDGTVTNSERGVSRQRPLFPAPGEARADWAIIAEVAARLGWGEHFAYAGPAAVFREHAAMTALAARRGKALDLVDKARLGDAAYDDMAPFTWGGRHPFAHGFSHPGGKARLIAVTPPAPLPEQSPSAEFPLRLNTGRYRDQWHTMTRTGLSATLAHHRREPLAEIHPDDAGHVVDGGLVRIVTARGASVFRAMLSGDQRRGEVFVPMHWTDRQAGGGRANRLSASHVDPVSGQPGFKNAVVRIEAVTPQWRAFLVARRRFEPEGMVWWSRSRVADGWLYEIAGDGAIDVAALLPAGPALEAGDLARGMRRIAVRAADGELDAALYVTRTGTLPPREWVAAQLGQADASAAELLAARPSAPAADRGPIVCVCHGIGALEIAGVIRAGAGTTAAVAEACRAGSNCGSCRPAIARLIAEAIPVQEDA